MTNVSNTRPAIGLIVAAMTVAILAACNAGSGSASAPAPSAAPSIGASAAIPAGFPIGAWTTTITADDLSSVSDEELATIRISRDNFIGEITGTFTTTFAADGSWSTLQETERPVKWPVFRGTFAPVGEDAFDQVTTFPPDFAGDVVRFTWRIEDGLLHLTVPDPPDPVLAIITEAHPWSPAG